MLCVVGALLLSVVEVAAGPPCEPAGGPSLSAGKDERGFFVTADWTEEFWRPRRGTLVTRVCDRLAREDGVTVLYVSERAESDVPRGRYSGTTPLAAARAFCQAAGLRVLTPARGLWVVDTTARSKDLVVTLFSRRLGSSESWVKGPEERELETAILSQLPIRSVCEGVQDCFMGIAYLPLSEADGPKLLVQAMSSVGLPGKPPAYSAFKVTVHRGPSGFTLGCLWSYPVSGPVVPEVDEDLDGDGLRDFVFSVDDYDEAMDSVISGRSGSPLFEFCGRELVVEDRPGGPKRVAVERVWVGVSDETPEPLVGPAVLVYSSENGVFAVEGLADDTSSSPTAASATRPPAGDAGALLANMLRSAPSHPSRVRRYLLRGVGAVAVAEGEAVVPVRRDWVERVTPSMVSKDFPARILFEFRLRGDGRR